VKQLAGNESNCNLPCDVLLLSELKYLRLAFKMFVVDEHRDEPTVFINARTKDDLPEIAIQA